MSTINALDPSEMEDAHRRALLDFAVGHSAAIFYIASLAGERATLFISNNVERLTGHAASWFLTKPGFGRAQIHAAERAAYDDALERLPAERERVLEYRFALGGGGWAWMRDSLRLVDQPQDPAGPLFIGCMTDITAEKEAVARQTEAESMANVLLRNAMDAIVATEIDGTVVEFNPTAEQLFGYARSEAIGRPVDTLLVPGAYRQRHGEGMRRFVETRALSLADRRMEVEALRKDGSTVPVELIVATTEVNGRTLMIGEIRDITDRLAARRERQRLTQLMRDAIESLAEGFVITDTDGRIVLCNEAFAQPYGRTPEEMVGRGGTEIIHAFFPNVRRFDGQFVEGDTRFIPRIVERMACLDGRPIEVELVDGTWREMFCHPTSDGGSVTLRADITARKKAELALRQSERLVRHILETSPVPLSMTRAEDGLILYESPASRQVFQRSNVGTSISARDYFVVPEDRDRYLDLLRRQGRVDGFETFMKRNDGSEFCAEISSRLVEYQGLQVIVASVFDLTERRRTESELARQREALYQSEKMSALGELLAGVSHELNNPLSVVVGQALLLRETATDAAITERARKISDAADRCARIVKTFLSMARRQPAASAAASLNAVVESALDVTAYMLRTSDVEVTLDLAEDLPSILADADQINQVVTNLVVNAHHALMEVAVPRRLHLCTRLDRRTREVVLTVRDNGPGVPPEIGSRVFEPFFTTKEVGSGTGLGLAICHRIVASHGGTIGLAPGESDGRGAGFELRFPEHRAPEADPVRTEDDPGSQRLTVLVIDDEREVAEIIREVLERNGHRVDRVISGRVALDRLAVKRYDVVLSDIRMPDLDGPSLYTVMMDRYPEAVGRLAFITGDTMSPAIRRFLEAAGRPYLEKPIAPADLRALVARLSGPAGPGVEHRTAFPAEKAS